MATSKKTSANVGVDNLTADAFVPDMEANKTREVLGDNAAPQKKWKVRDIVTYTKVHDQGADLFDIIDSEVESECFHMENGENDVVLLGCSLVSETESRKQFLRLVLKNVKTGVIETVSLFPGNQYTDMNGSVVPAGHNWKALVEEVKAQRNKAGVGYKPLSFTGFIQQELTKGFRTWLLWDGKYTNVYVTYKKYQAAVDRLAKAQSKGK